MNATTDSAHKMITEEIPVAGSELLARIRTLLEEGRVRHIRVKSQAGETYFELPLAVGVIGGAALAWASPFLAMAGALAGLVSSVRLEVVRENEAGGMMEGAAKTAKAVAAGARKATGRAAKRTAIAAKRIAKPARAAAKATRPAAKRGGSAARTARGKARRARSKGR